jgi:hypothetical protein
MACQAVRRAKKHDIQTNFDAVGGRTSPQLLNRWAERVIFSSFSINRRRGTQCPSAEIPPESVGQTLTKRMFSPWHGIGMPRI